MPRADFVCVSRLRVRWAEVDMQKIVFNGHYLTYIDTAVAEYWREIGLPYPQGYVERYGAHGPLHRRAAIVIWWEDFKVGDVTEMGRHTFTEEEIVAFGRQYDPQPFHIDAAAAQAGPFGGLIASGWQVCAIGMRLVNETFINPTQSFGSPGNQKVPWLEPGRPPHPLPDRLTLVGTPAPPT